MDELITEFLGFLERTEARLLSWGLVDGYFPQAELIELAEAFLAERQTPDDITADELVREATKKNLLFRFGSPNSRCYRTRMGETVRLLARLKQLFPKHLNTSGAWRTAPNLVSDFRLVQRPREYPRRDIAAGDWTAQLNQVPLTSLQRQIAAQLVNGRSLAGFQTRAFDRIASLTGGDKASGTVVCAGTGSGKTLAFYLPALTHLAKTLEQDESHWVRALAIYPRNELLKDQFTETLRQIRLVNPLLRQQGKRPLSIGTFFGSTPPNANSVATDGHYTWDIGPGGRYCPFALCPDCDGRPSRLVWRDTDRNAGRQALWCPSCNALTDAGEIILTRDGLQRHPPDILFTTTEMLNQRMTDRRFGALFGIGVGASKKPQLLLLDEAHNYSGPQGAQVAYLLRRWRHRAQVKPHCVGLSATLMEAAAFFAQLTGLDRANVEEISPETQEMVSEGTEYLVALRGDPVSGASLLSTTIQTAMLLRRCLTPNDQHSVFFGSKIFLFTDDLDVTNRMFFNVRDAEGQNSHGQPDPRRHPEGSLANLRASNGPEANERFLLGQSWSMPETLGHTLTNQGYVWVGRVSSQDSGVEAAAEIVVATASLEVGFNDPDVGAVIQHKAPRDSAAFLQRKGRGGRRRGMRPWTVVVLSDFGRDRLAYQGYDLLFDPELRPRELPLGNRHVLKMQAAYASLDWLSAQLPAHLNSHVWRDASEPPTRWNQATQTAMAAIVQRVLEGGDELQQLSRWLKYGLGLRTEAEVDALLWEAPRALMTSVLPRLHRRLSTGWRRGSLAGGGVEQFHKNHPLPEAVPSNLFSDLNLPEVLITVPLGIQGQNEEVFNLPTAAALREFAPGRISKRYGIRHQLSRHWIPLDPAGPGIQEVPVSDFFPEGSLEELGMFSYRTAGQTQQIRTLRPYAMRVNGDAPQPIKDSSNAMPIWHSQILPSGGHGAGIVVDLPTHSPWRGIIQELRFFTHREFAPATVRRFTLGSNAVLRFGQGQEASIQAPYSLDGEPVALGYAYQADALRVEIHFPEDLADVGQGGQPSQKLPSLRTARFRWLVSQDSVLSGISSIFQRGWLAEVCLAAIGVEAISKHVTLEAAWQNLQSGRGGLPLQNVLRSLFQASPTVDEEDEDHDADMLPRRLQELESLLHHPDVLNRMDEIIEVLWSEPNDTWTPWLRKRFATTLGAGLHAAIQQLCQDLDADHLMVDTDEEEAVLWITEDSPGGGGILEKVLPAIAEHPQRFCDLIAAAVGPSDYEVTDRKLRRLISEASGDEQTDLQQGLMRVRNPVGVEDFTCANTNLRGLLKAQGYQPDHALMAALGTRMLRPGSSQLTDEMLQGILTTWETEETRLGVEIEARTLAFTLRSRADLDQGLASGDVGQAPPSDIEAWRMNAIYGLLWPRGAQARNLSLRLRNPFAIAYEPERLLVTESLDESLPEVRVTGGTWVRECENQLVETSRVVVVANHADLPELQRGLLRLLVTPLDAGSLLLHPRLRGINRRDGDWLVHLDLVAPTQFKEIATEDGEQQDAETSRLMVKATRQETDELRDMLESVFAVELLRPGKELWLVSPWVSDIPILDNRCGSYSGLDPAWPKRQITFAEVLAYALRNNLELEVKVVTRPDEWNKRFAKRLQYLAELDGTGDRLSIDAARANLHTKGVAGNSFALLGSMNFTHNGIQILEETLQLDTSEPRLAQLRMNLTQHYPF
jgi:hypothetical protein